LPGSLKIRKGVKTFLQNTSIFARRPKKGEIKLPGSLKKKELGEIFP